MNSSRKVSHIVRALVLLAILFACPLLAMAQEASQPVSTTPGKDFTMDYILVAIAVGGVLFAICKTGSAR